MKVCDKQHLLFGILILIVIIKMKLKIFVRKMLLHSTRKAGLFGLFCLYYCANIQSWFLYSPANKSNPKLIP